jgi:hypothetical protein
MSRLFLFAFFAIIIFSSCEISVKTGPGSEEPASKIRNGIVVNSNGVKVEQAFLLFEDGSLVPHDNKIKVGQKVQLRLIVSGWKEKDGKVFLDASEKAETSEGDVFLDEKDLFRQYENGLDPADAGYITLSVAITGISKLYDHFKVSFRVADKTDENNFAEGYYKLYL